MTDRAAPPYAVPRGLPRAAVAIAALAAACQAGPAARSGRWSAPPTEILSCVDLPREDRHSHNLSGLAWDPAARRLYAISDRDKWITVLEPRPGFLGFDLRSPIALDIAIDAKAWDGEALAIAGDRFLVVANEDQPVIYSIDRSGRGATRIELPEFRGTRDNRGLEGIGYASGAGGRYVFAVNEQALEGDGPTCTAGHGTVVRILRRSLDGRPDREVAYLTEPIFTDGTPADNGVSDLVALSADRVLLIERAFVQGSGNAVRIYDVDLRGAQDTLALGDARTAVPVRKRLVLDLALLADEPCSMPPVPQRRKSLDNYEGIAIGPKLPDGRQLLFLVSDDNDRPTQTPRLLTIAVARGAL